MKKRNLIPIILPLVVILSSCGSKTSVPDTSTNKWTLDQATRNFMSTYKYTLDPGPDGITANLNLENMLSTDDTITITGVLRPTAEMIVPETVRGLKVTKLGPKSFSSRTLNTRLEKVSLPSSIVSIDDEAFEGDQNLTTIDFADVDNLSYIGKNAFGSLVKEEETISGSTKYYDEIVKSSEVVYLGKNLVRVPLNATGNLAVKEGTINIVSSALAYSKVSSIDLPDSLERIDYEAMKGCMLTELIVPDSVTYIGDKAFSDNLSLTKAYLPNNQEFKYSENTSYFEGSINIKELRFDGNAEVRYLFGADSDFEMEIEKISVTPSKDKKLVKNSLKGIKNLKSLNLVSSSDGSNVEVLEDNSLPSDLSSLTEFTYSDNFEYLGDSEAFYNSPFYNSLPNGLVYFGKNLAGIKGSVSSATNLIEGITGVSSGAVKNLLEITSLPTTIKYIGSSAFEGNTSITTVDLENVLSISKNAFADCPNIETINLNLSCEISKGAFLNDINVKTLDFNPSISLTDLFGPKMPSIETISLSEGVKKINDSAFEGLETLKEIDLPSTLEVIGAKAFKGCKSLKKVIIPESVKEIGAWAFSYCDSLESVFFEETTKTHPDQFAPDIIRPDIYLTINNFAFAYNTKLTGEFTLRNRTSYVGGGIVFGSNVTSFRIEIDHNYLHDLSYSRFNPLNEDNDMTFQNSWNLTDKKDSYGNQIKIGFKAVRVDLVYNQ